MTVEKEPFEDVLPIEIIVIFHCKLVTPEVISSNALSYKVPCKAYDRDGKMCS